MVSGLSVIGLCFGGQIRVRLVQRLFGKEADVPLLYCLLLTSPPTIMNLNLLDYPSRTLFVPVVNIC